MDRQSQMFENERNSMKNKLQEGMQLLSTLKSESNTVEQEKSQT